MGEMEQRHLSPSLREVSARAFSYQTDPLPHWSEEVEI